MERGPPSSSTCSTCSTCSPPSPLPPVPPGQPPLTPRAGELPGGATLFPSNSPPSYSLPLPQLEEQEVLRAEHSRERVRGELRLHQGEVEGYTCTAAASTLPGAPPVFLATLTPIPHSSTSATSATSPTPVVVRVVVSHSEEVEEGRLYVSSTLLRCSPTLLNNPAPPSLPLLSTGGGACPSPLGCWWSPWTSSPPTSPTSRGRWWWWGGRGRRWPGTRAPSPPSGRPAVPWRQEIACSRCGCIVRCRCKGKL